MDLDTMNLTATTVLAEDHDGPGGWWPIFPLLWLLFFAAVAFVVIRTGWWRRGRCPDEYQRAYPGHAGQARLAERFAAGEIDEQEYRSRLAVLREPDGEGTSAGRGDLR